MQPQNNKGQSQEPSFIAEALLRMRRAFLYVFLFSLCCNLLLLGLPIYSLQVLDRVISSASVPTLINLTIIIVIAFGFYGIFSLVRSMILTRMCEWLDTKVSARLLSIGVAQNSVGSVTSSGTYLRDLQNIKTFIGGQGIVSMFDAPWSIIYFLVIYMINPALGFVALVGGVLLLGFAFLNEILTRKPFAMYNRAYNRTLELADTASRNSESIEAMGMMSNIRDRWNTANDKAQELQRLANGRSNIIVSGSRIVRMLIQIAITGVGAYLAIHNEVSVGGMIAASILSGRALAPFETSIALWKGLLLARDSLKRLEKAVANFPSMRGTMDLPEPSGKLAVENMFFAPSAAKPILKGINLSVEPGQMLGVIGPSAAGKSTFAKLAVGILPPTSGTVRLDGAEIFKWNREFLSKYIGYMPQTMDLFPGTVIENIARMEPEPDHKKVLEAAQMANVHEMILRLPEGYETEIKPGNMTLSPGQRQRIGLARALYNRPKFLVLDEPNINLDGEGEQALVRALQNIKQAGITCVVVAHRPNLVSNTDVVVILQDGKIKEFGPTQKVLGKYIAPSISEAGA